jgi:hypothetical protein
LLTGHFTVDDILKTRRGNLDILLLLFTYRFYKSDCFIVLEKALEAQLQSLERQEDQSVKNEIKFICRAYKSKGIEFISEVRNEIPIWMQFLMIEIINEKEHDIFSSK